jgi:hypothetical protein
MTEEDEPTRDPDNATDDPDPLAAGAARRAAEIDAIDSWRGDLPRYMRHAPPTPTTPSVDDIVEDGPPTRGDAWANLKRSRIARGEDAYPRTERPPGQS